jgi:hypothetical protein
MTIHKDIQEQPLDTKKNIPEIRFNDKRGECPLITFKVLFKAGLLLGSPT